MESLPRQLVAAIGEKSAYFSLAERHFIERSYIRQMHAPTVHVRALSHRAASTSRAAVKCELPRRRTTIFSRTASRLLPNAINMRAGPSLPPRIVESSPTIRRAYISRPGQHRSRLTTRTPAAASPDSGAQAERSAPSVLGAMAMVTSSTVGAGILALPSVTAPAGFAPSATMMLSCWLLLAIEALCIAEVNCGVRDRMNAGEEDKEGETIISITQVRGCSGERSCGQCGEQSCKYVGECGREFVRSISGPQPRRVSSSKAPDRSARRRGLKAHARKPPPLKSHWLMQVASVALLHALVLLSSPTPLLSCPP